MVVRLVFQAAGLQPMDGTRLGVSVAVKAVKARGETCFFKTCIGAHWGGALSDCQINCVVGKKG